MDEDGILANNKDDLENKMREFICAELQNSLASAERALSNPKYREEDTAKARMGYDTAFPGPPHSKQSSVFSKM